MIDNDKKGDGTTDQKHRIDSDLQQERTWPSAPYLGRCQEIPASLLKTKQFNSLNILPIQDDIAGWDNQIIKMNQPNPAVSFKDDLKLMKNENGIFYNLNQKTTRNSEDLNWLNEYTSIF